ncbi:MAG: cytochrome c oxidase accessory protein CcoG [Saccharospirillum sp.]
MSKKIDLQNITENEDGAVDLYVGREHIYIRRIKGFYRNLRVYGGAFLFLLYFGTLWLDWGDRQAVLFDLPNRQFHVFGITFWPQDAILLSWALIIAAFGLFLVTVFAGRVWCGYTCPQSVWTWIFVFIEEKTEGKRNARKKRDEQGSGPDKWARKGAKHLLWLLVALVTAVTFVGYFTPIKQLIPDLITLQAHGWAFFWIGFFTLATYGNAGWLREQVCIYMCPYARFQSVMFDQDTLIVSYDEQRGEPRGARKRGTDRESANLGDCIDCDLCVQVCPTGIDIRDGLQYECITCAACIDACNSVMDKMGYEPGLIRYTTEHSLQGKETKILRPRLIGYAAAMLVMISVFSYVLLTRIPLELTVERGRGVLFSTTTEGDIENTYLLRVLNKAQSGYTYKLTATGPEGLQLFASQTIALAANEATQLPVRLVLDPDAFEGPFQEVMFRLEALSEPRIAIEQSSQFFGPSNF